MQDDIKKILTSRGLKATLQRIIILDYLLHTDSHPTVEMIYKELQKRYPTITLSTVYNTVEVLSEKGIINKIYTPTGTTRYDGKTEKHFHIYDEKKDEVIDLYDEKLYKLIQDYLKNNPYTDFEIKDFQIIFNGTKH